MKTLALAGVIAVSAFLVGCETDATVANSNMTKAAEQFEINRRIVFINGITNDYILTVEGYCSIEADGADKQLEVLCKKEDGSFVKHFLGLSDNVSYIAQQIEPVELSVYRHRVIFKPETVIPNIDFESSLTD